MSGKNLPWQFHAQNSEFPIISLIQAEIANCSQLDPTVISLPSLASMALVAVSLAKYYLSVNDE